MDICHADGVSNLKVIRMLWQSKVASTTCICMAVSIGTLFAGCKPVSSTPPCLI